MSKMTDALTEWVLKFNSSTSWFNKLDALNTKRTYLPHFKKYCDWTKRNPDELIQLKIEGFVERKGSKPFFADRIERAWEAIGIIDTRHGKFLNPDLQCSLLDIEDSLHKLSFELHFTDANMDDREKFLKIELRKLSKELGKLRERKLVDIGF